MKPTGSIWVCVKEFITLTFKIPNLTDEDVLFHFMDGLYNLAKKELDQRYVNTIEKSIIQAESLTDIKQERHDRVNGRGARSSHAKGGGDCRRGKK